MRAYAILALRIDRQLSASGGGPVLMYSGPGRWSSQVRAEQPPPPGLLAEDCEHLLHDLPFDGSRARYLAAQLRSMRVFARRLAGEDLPLGELARQCLGVAADWQPESLFEAAHAELDAALPAATGSLAQRLHAWQGVHTLRSEAHRLPELAGWAVTETRARTNAIVPLPPDTAVECRLSAGPHRGQYLGERRSVIHLNNSAPFNLADLLYVVAHEGFPGHIAESMLKDIELVGARGLLEHQVRFMISPSFVVSEGLGLHAQDIIFPGDEAQAWLTDAVLAPQRIPPDGSDFAAIQHARNVLWGVWGNAAFLAADGRSDVEIGNYLARWALLTEAETKWALDAVRAPGMSTYVLGYYHGWRILRSWLDHPERSARVRRLLTEPLLPADLEPGSAT